ncbi:MAG: ROK family protein [Rhodothermales bacterium]
MPTAVTPRLIAGIDTGGTNIRFALAEVDDPRTILVRRIAETPLVNDPEQFGVFIATELASCLHEAGFAPEALAAVGCTAPGITDAGSGVVRASVNLGWIDFPLVEVLERHLGIRAAIENDVNAAALAEFAYGAGQGCHSLIYVTISTGLGAGIVIEGNVLRGYQHAAGEIGFLLPEPSYIERTGKQHGCLEHHASGTGIARAWQNRQNGRTASVSAIEVFDAARAGNLEAKAMVERAADYLAQAAVAISTIIDPEVLVLGGSIAQNEDALTDRIREVVTLTLPFPPRVVQAGLAGDAPLIGALALGAQLARRNGLKPLRETPV